jgi:eukaryotic-like serine/threonine-protein kinase
VRARIADYVIIRPVADDHGESGAASNPPSHLGAGATGSDTSAVAPEALGYLATAPARLGLGEAPVVVQLLPGAVRTEEESWITALAGVRSPHLPGLLEVGSDDRGEGDPARYWSHGWTGEATLAAPPFALSLAFVLWLLAGAGRGAHALHEAGLVHGGILPSTVRFNERSATLDLPRFPGAEPPGLVQRIDRVDALDYLDPAVVRGELPSRASDIWTLGAVLHWGLSGQRLHPGLGQDPAVTAVQRVMFEPPTVATGIDPEAEELVTACLAPHPDRRIQTAADFADRCEALGRRR